MSILSWRCGICGKEREDKFISVISYFLKLLPGAEVNLKYCNDKSDCLEGAIEKAKTKEL